MDSLERRRIGERASITGIACNLFLFLLKMLVGTAVHSLSVIADAFNNLTDSISSLVSYVSVHLSGKPADHEHPYGHGRTEYIANFMVALLILLVGANLFRSSIERLLSPAELQISTVGILLLSASILVKFALFLFFRHAGRKADLPLLLLTSKDALFDCLTTLITIIALLLTPYVSTGMDAWAALALSCLILFTSVRLIRDSVSPLLGGLPNKELTDALVDLAKQHQEVIDVHDVVLHDYGYHLYVGSMHIELSETLSFHDAHFLADAIEQEALNDLSIQLVVHADPVRINDPLRAELLSAVQKIVSAYGQDISVHDFQLDQSSHPVRLSFDVQIPFQSPSGDEQNLKQELTDTLLKKGPDMSLQIHIDHV